MVVVMTEEIKCPDSTFASHVTTNRHMKLKPTCCVRWTEQCTACSSPENSQDNPAVVKIVLTTNSYHISICYPLSCQLYPQFLALVKDLCKCNFSFSFCIHLKRKSNCYFLRSDEMMQNTREIKRTT